MRAGGAVWLVLFLASMARFGLAESYRDRYPLPVPGVPQSLGVNIHFTTGRPGEMKMLTDAGFRWVRMDFAWGQIERSPGLYDFSAYDALLKSLDRRHIRPILILDYGNNLYQKGAPTTPDAREAFVHFVSAAITHFRHRGILWEMWNEPNGGFWRPHADVNQYADLALDVGKEIRRVAADEWYIGPATSGMDFAFLERCFQRGLLSYWDAVSFHPYRDSAPETAAADFQRVRRLIAQYAPPGRHVPMIASEWGYSELYAGMNLEKQGRYISREFLVDMANGILFTIWYDWHDDGPDPANAEHHFGTVTLTYQEKPAYRAVHTLSRALSGFRFGERLALASGQDYCLQFRRGHETRLVLWTASGKPHTVDLPLAQGSFEILDNLGGRTTARATAAGLSLQLTGAPEYVLPAHRDAAAGPGGGAAELPRPDAPAITR